MNSIRHAMLYWILITVLTGGCAAPAAPSPTAAPKAAVAAPATAPTTAPAAPAPTAAPAKVTAPEVKPVVLKLSHQSSPASAIHEGPFQTFMANVEKRSNGRIKFEYYPSEQLVKAREGLQAVRTGIADIQISTTAYTPEAFPLFNLYALPFAHKSGEESFRSLIRLRDEYINPEIDRLGVKLLTAYFTPGYNLFSVQKPIRKVDDLKGMRVRSPGAEMSKVLGKMGAQAVSLSAADIYEALQKRTVDVAAHTSGYLGETLKVYETTKTGSFIDAGGLGAASGPLVMNKNSWDKLTTDLQKTLEEEAVDLGLKISINYDQADARGLKLMLDNGVTSIVWDDSEKAKLKKLGMEVWDEEGAKLDGKGFPATKLLNEFKAGR